ncbi:RNA ligase-domain-containing protein [Cantharellus anzutake]|uniref:RNA ligase-domain-containing protein n=1 Tax=Cantharellus anzutake TaxID=1750568 RepID=UPI001902D197|nr:RNA ligase-domain-containing protein [Cantharellus anzutake]KAF8343001.1 RNA ligase-domain-containing protein [Cantharellus anzutake]
MSSDSIAEETDALIQKLNALSIKDKRLVKSTTHLAPADLSIEVQSWKMNEFKYATYPSPFPTLARGLFTRQALTDDDKCAGVGGQHTVVARGYDKFFNIGEVPWNTWPALEKNTTAPYYLTLKSNGCIIFVAALANDKLIVTSKHSVGQHTGAEISHAMQGEKWLYKHLKAKGKKPEELASRLLRENITAVAELCDDSFEEHVLAYPPELTGLHLHGLNKNQGAFSTAPPSDVDAFAEEFGFIKTAYVTLNSVNEVKEFTDDVAQTGFWNGDAVEGFVVRTRVKARDSSEAPAKVDPRDIHTPPPYPPGTDFFFKVKFDEPYLMYRAWREITKTILSYKRDSSKPLNIPKSRLERPESRVYRNWVEDEIDAHPKEFEGFSKGQGVVATRERFLKWLETPTGQRKLIAAGGALKKDGAHALANPEAVTTTPRKEFGKTIIVPIAVPGCGKTALSVALSRLFGFGHTQSDDVKAKKTASIFQSNITKLLKEYDVVIADRNNHLRQHRVGILEAGTIYEESVAREKRADPLPIRLIALYWNIRKAPLATVHRLCADRILRRGDNHQSLRPAAVSHEEIIWLFITGSQELADGEVDDVIELDPRTESLEENVRKVIDGLLPLLPDLQRPNDEQIAEACDFALGYKVTVKKESQATRTKDRTRYYGLLAEIDLLNIVEKALSQDNAPNVALKFWDEPHITIVHSNSLPAEERLWDACNALNRPPGPRKNSSTIYLLPLFDFSIGSLLCDGNVMALTVEDLRVRETPENDVGSKAAHAVLAAMNEDRKIKLHITVGTKGESVSAVLAGEMVTKWRKGEKSGIGEVSLENQNGSGLIKGLS